MSLKRQAKIDTFGELGGLNVYETSTKQIAFKGTYQEVANFLKTSIAQVRYTLRTKSRYKKRWAIRFVSSK